MQTDNGQDNVVLVDFAGSNKDKNTPIQTQATKTTVEKQQVFEEFLKAGIVSVAFDPRTPDAEIPRRFRKSTDLIFNYSYGYRIEDFRYDGAGITATLMFPEGYYTCIVPWHAVFSMRSEALQMESTWPSDLPTELHVDIPKAPSQESPKRIAHLTLVKNDE